jgi:acyl-CoA thioesterase
VGSIWDDLDLTVTDTPGRFTATVGEAWLLVAVPQGGVLAAIATRAMAQVLDRPEQSLRSLSAVFAGQVANGPVEVEVAVLRRGRSMSQLTATVRNPGAAAGLTTMAVFGAVRRGFAFTELPFPEVPGPESLRSFRDPAPPEAGDFRFDRPLPFWAQVLEGRAALGELPWEPHVPSRAEQAFWYRFDDPPVSPDGALDPAGVIVLCDTMPGAVHRKLGPDVDRWFGPSADFTMHLLGQARPGWVLAHNRARHAGDGYASVEMTLWDPETRALVAYATQMMFFAFGA